jgi:hypothetical protein
MCSSAKKCHPRRHHVIPIDEADAAALKGAPQCDAHHAPLNMFCKKCEVLVCTQCCILSHVRHECVEAESIAHSRSESVQALVRTASEAQLLLSQSMEFGQKEVDRIQMTVKSQLEKIDEHEERVSCGP